ncbi:MAG TPA: hypothetical protein VMF08_21945 [Candidatus Sulfotelmatobacter sp.]|nr:hypothetical protein [Candidatus Sulfotelmatobacter sp.]
MFSTLTGGRLGFKFQPSVATLMIENMTSTFRFIDLDEQEIKKALHQAEARGVTGGRVHDGLHAVAAKKSGATELLTLNVGDFSGLEDGFQLARP